MVHHSSLFDGKRLQTVLAVAVDQLFGLRLRYAEMFGRFADIVQLGFGEIGLKPRFGGGVAADLLEIGFAACFVARPSE